jgi:NAD(P)-dependent dehydrogenase (short-subunit alcohol dehydrogenase family)
MRRAFVLLTLVAFASPASAQQPQGTQRTVLVTGANSGIGRRITETLASEGTFVYAGARRAEDIAALSKIPNVQGVRLDVTVPAEIAAAVETVRKGGRGLDGVVNNAGVAVVGPLIEMEDKELTSLFEVNTYGPYRVVRAFAPMLIASKGRVVTISSISGVLSGPFLGAYSMSKHAVEAFGDALGAEMGRLGVRSSLVEPGNYRSEIGRNTMAQVEAAMKRATGGPFEQPMRGMQAAMGRYDSYPEPDDVAKAVSHALFDPNPRVRYMVVPEARQAEVTIRKAVDELVQLNAGHRFTYDRETLVKMLDSSLAKVK